jgi:hypothetical protein
MVAVNTGFADREDMYYVPGIADREDMYYVPGIDVPEIDVPEIAKLCIMSPELFARVILVKPAVVILDEATSALDEPAEARLYRLIRKLPNRPTVVSVGHRSTLRQFHDKICDIGTFR